MGALFSHGISPFGRWIFRLASLIAMPFNSFGSDPCIVRRQHPIKCPVSFAISARHLREIDSQENATSGDRVRRDSVDILV